MSTALATVESSRFAALAPNSDVGEALKANLAHGETIDESMLIRVKTPAGGATTWIIPGVSGDETAAEITGLLVGFFPRGVLWPAEEPAEGTLPVLITHDLITAYAVGAVPEEMADILEPHRLPDGSYDWQKLPYTQFGSGKGGFGKRAKEQRVMFILRESDPFPLVVTAQPGSLRPIRAFVPRLPVPHYRAIVSLGLEKVKSRGGQAYARIVPKLVGTIDKESGEKIRNLYTVPLGRVAKRMDVEHGSEDDE